MFRIATKTARLLVVGGLVAGVGLPAAALATTSSASAAPKAPATPTAGLVDQWNGVGSDTIFCVDNKSTAKFNANTPAGVNPNGNQANNTPPALSLNIGCETTPASVTIPADNVHAAITYNSGNLPPFGSSAGISALVNDAGAGNVAYARSSRGPKVGDASGLEFYAFALDAVSWNHFAGHAPANLTQAQLQGIYKCTAGVPQFTDWSQVGGTAGPIVRYTAQAGSGTRSFFESILLNGNSSDDPTCTVRSINVPENDATQIAEADEANAIFPYSLGVYTAQRNHATTGETDLRVGTTLGGVNGVTPTLHNVKEAAALSNEQGVNACTATPPPAGFCGARYVYHVTWAKINPAAEPSYYSNILDFLGVHSTANGGSVGALCKNDYSSDIRLFGFQTLANAPTAAGYPRSHCRLFITP